MNKPRNYNYSILIIQLVVQIKLKTSTTFRAIESILIILSEKLNWGKLNPSHVTIGIWIRKIGYYYLTKAKTIANDRIIILDETIQIGQNKLLMIYGIRESKIPFGRALKYTDLVPLMEISKNNWNGEIVSKKLMKLEQEIGHIKYAIGDHGSIIKNGLSTLSISHVHDITHKIALILKKIYENDKQYNELRNSMSALRLKVSQSSLAYITPPKQRKKSRYQNIQVISKRGIAILKCLTKKGEKNQKKEIMEKLKRIVKYKKFIKELNKINKSINKIEKIIKTQGISKKTIEESMLILNKLSGKKANIMKAELKKYFDETMELLPNTKTILGTSDIIESAFGKYKNYLSDNYMIGITDLSLCLSAFTVELSEKNIKESLENTKMGDLEEWKKENIGMTILKQRQNMYN